MDVQQIIKQSLPELAKIINAIPGEIYTNTEAETLAIMQRRLPECELRKQLEDYNEIFVKKENVEINDITKSEIAYIKIKVLSDAMLLDFDAKSLRNLIKECKSNIDKTTNILRLSKAHMLTAEDFQKSRIEKTTKKNESFIQALENVISDVEAQIERIPKPLEIPDKEYDFADESISETSPGETQIEKSKTKVRMSERLHNIITSERKKSDVEEQLREAEKESSETECKEIPFYDKVLIASEIMPCKDFQSYCLLKKKDNVYFGLTKNITNNIYDNRDQSLIELTEITEEFLQYMTSDLLSDEYEILDFSEAEKVGMKMYFNFVSKCFESHIGTTLNVSEYLAFKKYYNRLVSLVLKIENKKLKDYYRALPIADEFLEMMSSYNMVLNESKRSIVDGLITNRTDFIRENLTLLLEHHIVDEESKVEVKNLIEKITYFHDEAHFKKTEALPVNEDNKHILPQDIPLGFIQPVYTQPPIYGNLFFTLQCLNKEKEVVDEAYFATTNMPQAMEDYKSRDAYIKRFGLVQDGRFVPLLSSEEGE